MRIFTLWLVALCFITLSAKSQNLYTLSNAANIENEVNATTGWTGPAAITSSTNNPQAGTYSILITTNANGNRHGQFTFPATVGTVYNISIWARRGTSNSNSAFSNWFGFSGFTTTSIPSTTWEQFNFTLTATSANPIIRVYGSTGGPAGRSVYVDAISITVQVPDTEPPTAPTNLAATNTTSTSTTLSWTASTDNIAVTGYQIRQNNVMIGTVNGTTTTYNVTGLTGSTTYNFDVVATDAANNVSPPSNTVQVTTLAGTDTEPPTAPTNLAASNTTATSTTLNWTASTDNIAVTGYQILQNNTLIGTVNGTTTTYNVTGLTASTTYSFNVVAVDAANNVSLPSNTVQVTTLAGTDLEPPTAPTNLTATNTTATSTTLNWTASTDNIAVTGYQILQNNVMIGTINGTTTTYNVTGLTASTLYSFNVIAVDAANNVSPPSNTVQVTTSASADTQAPTAPTNLAATNTTATSTTLNWTASTDNIGVTGYQIRQNNVLIGTVNGTTTTYNVTGLTASTTYSFNVVAVDAANNVSPPSNTVQVTTSAGADTQSPTAPTNLTASNTTSSATTLNWTASTDNIGVTGYQIFRNNVSIATIGATTTYTATGLTASTTYTFYVVARDAANNVSSPSNTVSVTTLSGGGGGTPYTTTNANLPTVNWQANDFYSAGTVGIGTAPPNAANYRLAVDGTIRTKELRVESGWSDFVFEPDYRLLSLKEVEEFIIKNGHLKDIPPATYVQANGVKLAEINMRLLQKIEELTLYIIQVNKRISELETAENSTTIINYE